MQVTHVVIPNSAMSADCDSSMEDIFENNFKDKAAREHQGIAISTRMKKLEAQFLNSIQEDDDEEMV